MRVSSIIPVYMHDGAIVRPWESGALKISTVAYTSADCLDVLYAYYATRECSTRIIAVVFAVNGRSSIVLKFSYSLIRCVVVLWRLST